MSADSPNSEARILRERRLELLFASVHALQLAEWLTYTQFAVAWDFSISAVRTKVKRKELETIRRQGDRRARINNWVYRQSQGMDVPPPQNGRQVSVDGSTWADTIFKDYLHGEE